MLLVDNGGAGDPIVIYGHMDKQPPLGEWRQGLGPYEPVRQGDLLYGRGTADDGYSTFAAVTGLVEAGGGHGRVLVLIEASEESGSPDLAAYLEHLAPRIGTPRLVMCLDSGGLSYDRLWLTTSLRGMLIVTVTVDVLTEGIHSGQGGGVVPSSFRILRRILSGIEDEVDGRILLPELLGAGMPDAHRANLEALAAEFPDSGYPVVDGLHLLGDDALAQAGGADMGRRARGGRRRRAAQAARGGNVLRPSTTLKLAVRLPPDVDVAGGLRRAHLGHPHRRRGARHHRRRGRRPGLGGAAARRRHRGDPGPGVQGTIRRVPPARWARAAPSRSWPTCRRAFPGCSSWRPACSARTPTRTGPTSRCTSRWARP